MLDKARTYELAARHGIPTPRVLQLRSDSEMDQAIAEMRFPCVLKPVHSHLFVRRAGSGAKVEFIETPEELRQRVASLHEQGVEMLVTEVIVGASDEFVSYYGYLDRDGQSLLTFTKCKLRQQPPGFGLGTYHRTTLDPEVAAAGLSLLRAAGIVGLGNVEFKRDAGDGELKLIECNVRFTLSNELIRRSGLDLALFCYCRAAGLTPPAVGPYKVGMTLWDPIKDARAFRSYRQLGELTAPGWIASVARPQCFPTFRVTDPMPAIMRTAWMVQNARDSSRATQVVSTGSSHRIAPAPGQPRVHRRLPVVARSVERLAGAGRRGRSVAARLDLLASSGLGPLWRRARAEGQLAGLGDSARDRLYERIWTEAAAACGAEVSQLAPGLFELTRGQRRTRVYQQTVEMDDPVTLRVALDKAVVHRLMAERGVPTPERIEWRVDDPAPALEFLQRAGGPCVVKPAAGTGGGHGVTPGIETAEELMRARIHAATGGERLLIERQVAGDVYRLLFLDGELLDVVRSVPASLTGDGRATVEQLIARENLRRARAQGAAGLSLLGINLDTVLTLEHAGLRLSSVVAAGRHLQLRAATNNNAAEDNQTWPGEVAAEVVDAARNAAAAVGLRLAGIDVVGPSLAAPLEETGAIIAEVNGTPGLHHHYLVADPDRATRVAIPVLERLLSEAVGDSDVFARSASRA
jgi:cyanophycin synthetase